MKKTLLALTTAVSILTLSACNSDDDEIIASTKYGEITKEDLYEELKSYYGSSHLQQMLLEQILENNYEVTDQEVSEELKKAKKQLGGQYEAFLSTNNMDEESYKKYIRVQLLQQKAVSDVNVTDADIRDYYNKAKYELKARYIFFRKDNKIQAEEMLRRLQLGEEFREVAKDYSVEFSEELANSTENLYSELDWFSYGAAFKEFNGAVYDLDMYEISNLVESKEQGGYYIIQLIDKRENDDYGTLEENKEDIKKAIQLQKGDWDSIASKLIKKANVNIKDTDLVDALDYYTKSK